jgi:hypothetical protein
VVSCTVAAVRRIGVKEVLIGALDEQMMTACEKAGVPCVLIRGGGMQEELKKCGGNMRKCPAIYPLMSVLKVRLSLSQPLNLSTSQLSRVVTWIVADGLNEK